MRIFSGNSQNTVQDYETLLASLAQAFWETDDQGSIVADSPSWRACTGQSPEQWLAEGWIGAVHPDEHADALLHWQEALTQRQPFQIDIRLQHPESGWRWTSVRAVPIFDSTDSVQKWLGVGMAIHEHKPALLEQDQPEPNFRTFLETITQMTWTGLPSGEVNYFNPRWYEYTGLTYEQTRNWDWTQVVHPDDLFNMLAAFERVKESGEPFVVEVRYRGTDGHYRWFLNKALPIRDEQGQITLWVGTATDVQDQKDQTERLETEVADRTQALLLANQNLQRSNENLQQFAYVASHDLQEPLRKVQSFSSLLQRSYRAVLGASGLDLLQRIQLAGERMSALIRDLLIYSRFSTRQQEFGVVSLEAIVADVLDTLALIIEPRHARIEVASMTVVRGDESQLSQLFQNLISNAIKFTPQDRSPQIRIDFSLRDRADLPPEVEPTSPARQFYQISVQDQGVGFDPKYRERIFEVFQRLHSKEQYAGTGVGLAICQRVVENHGGAITADSQPGQGTTFWVYLPV